ncbi:helix-turn-helix domain-containing protein [Planomonospora sp. ID91781]|uniref:helix-turn-helix domain-containing protein n=1 Tax=Planomonospora sp. ID91781 TaxID=2738135 RepID=UPI0018C3C6B8|nr:helix-turn-helix domain-containing protein [Planomonospora sp. ID91781]MBG0819320.1 helix-turn-helix domain-containing protein [Planomonospora sp. ID91781]
MRHSVIQLVPRQTGPSAPDPDTATGRSCDGRAVYTVAEVARLLSLSRGSAYASVRDGTIPAIRVGGRWVIPKRRFHTWLDGLAEGGEH